MIDTRCNFACLVLVLAVSAGAVCQDVPLLVDVKTLVVSKVDEDAGVDEWRLDLDGKRPSVTMYLRLHCKEAYLLDAITDKREFLPKLSIVEPKTNEILNESIPQESTESIVGNDRRTLLFPVVFSDCDYTKLVTSNLKGTIKILIGKNTKKFAAKLIPRKGAELKLGSLELRVSKIKDSPPFPVGSEEGFDLYLESENSVTSIRSIQFSSGGSVVKSSTETIVGHALAYDGLEHAIKCGIKGKPRALDIQIEQVTEVKAFEIEINIPFAELLRNRVSCTAEPGSEKR